MALSWSHTVIIVKDEQTMLDFYTRVLGFQVTDRGPIADDRSIIFLSQQPDEHHQVGFLLGRAEAGPSNSVAHLAFRTDDMAELRARIAKLEAEGVAYRPTSHGNTWSVYFQDPEMNGIEIFCATPWHVRQPQGEVWNTRLSDAELRDWTEATFKSEPEFSRQEDYIARRRKELAKT